MLRCSKNAKIIGQTRPEEPKQHTLTFSVVMSVALKGVLR
jgi:hypothetical protein